MAVAARASMKQKPCCYSLLDTPLIDFLYGEKKKYYCGWYRGCGNLI
ncbi:MAG: hypothetical protein GX240_06375 [Candidatus Atribacteria bacterium]|nr:hypothetical protein [Candidatus Atribacteria bacterium]